MGLVTSRLDLQGLHPNRRRSHQEETMYSYSLNKNYFSNYFLMGGERFEVNDPDYLFGDNCDLNFLSCTKPYSLPYKHAQENLLSNLNSKQKANNKVSSRVSRLSSPLNILTNRHGAQHTARKLDAQTQTSNNNQYSNCKGSDPSQPLVMLINVRKETLRLVKSSNINNLDSVQNSPAHCQNTVKPVRKHSSTKQSRPALNEDTSKNRYSVTSYRSQINYPSFPSSATSTSFEMQDYTNRIPRSPLSGLDKNDEDITSLLSVSSSTRSGYASVKEDAIQSSDIERNADYSSGEEDFEDALNYTTSSSVKKLSEDSHPNNQAELDDDSETEKLEQQSSLLNQTKQSKESGNVRITIKPFDSHSSASIPCDMKTEPQPPSPVGCNKEGDKNSPIISHHCQLRGSKTKIISSTSVGNLIDNSNRVYNIEFYFDAEVDCSIRIFYFCTRELTSTGITYKPQHATYRSKIYYYKKGLNQKFSQSEHTFQPYLFDEDLLIYKPLDMEGNYNSGAVFPIVIHCVALDGPVPRQSQSLIATIEKSQLDDSYSIKPLKQLIFADGVQYILQDIYGVENGQLLGKTQGSRSRTRKSGDLQQASISKQSSLSNLRIKSRSLQSNLNFTTITNLSDTTSLASADLSSNFERLNRGSITNSSRATLGVDNSFECVICMSDDRDTMLLPCRHLCLCSSCAQSLKFQASSCPICRCPFKASLTIITIIKNLSTKQCS